LAGETGNDLVISGPVIFLPLGAAPQDIELFVQSKACYAAEIAEPRG